MFGGGINSSAFAAYVDAGGNLLLTASSAVGDAVRDVALEFGFEFDEEGNAVQDGVGSASDDPLVGIAATPVMGWAIPFVCRFPLVPPHRQPHCPTRPCTLCAACPGPVGAPPIPPYS